MSFKESPSQTAGPYVHIGCTPHVEGLRMYRDDLGAQMIGDAAEGDRIALSGAIHDGEGAPLTDALVEIWQADTNGRYASDADADPHFSGWGRTVADMQSGIFKFDTVKPGPVSGQAPHIALWIVARGLNLGLHTRIYFPDEDNSADPVLSHVPDTRRATLIASRTNAGYHIDIHLQGPQETVFLDM